LEIPPRCEGYEGSRNSLDREAQAQNAQSTYLNNANQAFGQAMANTNQFGGNISVWWKYR
jgi:hypothetical protein